MSFQLFYLVLFTQGETTYRLCLAFESQPQADSDRCETFTTLESDRNGNGGITDYSLYGIIVAAVISLLFICVIGKCGYYKKICFFLHFLLIDVDSINIDKISNTKFLASIAINLPNSTS